MTANSENQPEVGAPREPPAAIPVNAIPLAQLAGLSSASESGQNVSIPLAIAKPGFPEIDLGRLGALGDLCIVAILLFGGHAVLSQFAEVLIEQVPELGEFLFNTLLGVLALLSIAITLFIHRHSYASIGLRPRQPMMEIAAGVAALPVCYFVVAMTGFLYVAFSNTSVRSLAAERTKLLDMAPSPNVASLLLFAVFTGFFEELLFRGFLMTRLTALFKSKWAGFAISSILFGLAHLYQGAMGVVQTAALGFLFGGLVLLFRSIWPAIVAHAVFNGVSLSLMPLLRQWIEPLMHQTTSGPAL